MEEKGKGKKRIWGVGSKVKTGKIERTKIRNQGGVCGIGGEREREKWGGEVWKGRRREES